MDPLDDAERGHRRALHDRGGLGVAEAQDIGREGLAHFCGPDVREERQREVPDLQVSGREVLFQRVRNQDNSDASSSRTAVAM
jgi:hypothetical protein